MKKYTFDIPPHITLSGEVYGFVYLIENLTDGSFYVGRKSLKGGTNPRTYTGSSKPLNTDIKKLGLHNFKFEILEYCNTAKQLDMCEVKWMLMYDVLNCPHSYNQQIAGRWFKDRSIRCTK